MRVAYVCADPGVPALGTKGASIHVQEITRALLQTGAQVDLFAARLDGRPPDDLAFLRIHQLASAGKGDIAGREEACLRSNEVLRAALEREGPFDLIYERYSLWSFAAIEYARDSATPIVLEVNAALIEEQAEHRGLVNRAAAERIARNIFSTATAVIAVSDAVADYVRRFPGTDSRVHVVANGVNPERFGPETEPTAPAEPGQFTIGFVGNVRPWHGVRILLEAFAQVHQQEKETRLLIVGGGDEQEKLAREISSKTWGGGVQFTGPVQAAEVPGLLASMDAGVAPYPALEQFYFSPLKIYEYMAAGLPVVASRLGQIEQLIESGKDGLLVSPGDSCALAHALLQLRRDSQLCRRLGVAARATILNGHTWKEIVERVLTLAGVQLMALTNE